MDPSLANLSGKRKGFLSTHKLGFFLIVLGLIWGFYLLKLTSVYDQGRHRDSELLKSKIIELSKKYIAALSKEHSMAQMDVPLDGRSLRPNEMKRATTVLLQNMLDRIQSLETELHTVILNSTMEFAKMSQQIEHLNSSIHGFHEYTWVCEVPDDKSYPECASKVKWLQKNWRKNKIYAQNGVNGSLCSFLMYLSQVEGKCPMDFIKKRFTNEVVTAPTPTECSVPNDSAYPHCANKLEWMEKYWKSDPKYATRGVDGTRCSFLKYLSEVEDWCPLSPGSKKQSIPKCEIPRSPSFPQCGQKVAWMQEMWRTDPCYATFGVNGSICSSIMYLSEVESWCPLLPGREPRRTPSVPSTLSEKPDLTQRGIHDLIVKLSDPVTVKYKWIKSRLTFTWPNWLDAISSLQKKWDLKNYSRKKILIYIGLLADESKYNFGLLASTGGPLGELVQWSDLIASLYLLGHDITVCVDRKQVSGLLSTSMKGSCPNNNPTKFDIVYSDYIGLSHLKGSFGVIGKMKCHLRVVDSFGTEAQFNHLVGSSMKSMFFGYDLNLMQYNTMFPHSPDNTFLGFVVGKKVEEGLVYKKKPIALVYGKHPSMWTDRKKTKVLDIVSDYFEVHATVGPSQGTKISLPSYVVNHGVLQRKALLELLRSAKVFIGLGFPFEGPAPLEAIANGCFFLNAKMEPPLNRENSDFFKPKPTYRKLTSQHPYAEQFIGKPRVHTVNLNDRNALEDALKYMKNNTGTTYLPYEYTYEGMLERMYGLTKNQNFCRSADWPPLSRRKVFIGSERESCKDVCESKGLICEPAYFPSINDPEFLKKQHNCQGVEYKNSFVAPGMSTQSKLCTIQTEKQMYSCTAESATTKRICPCRDFIMGQIALCKGCI